MTENDIKNISLLLQKYNKIVFEPNESNDIKINRNVISIYKDGVELYKRELDIDDIRSKIESVPYLKNIFNNSDAKYSPFEADRDENKEIWSYVHTHIRFPSFIPVLLFSLLYVGYIPSIFEFCRIYLMTYTEGITYSNPYRFIHYKIPKEMVKDRSRVGKQIIYEGTVIQNNLLRYKEEYEKYLNEFDLNEFTTEFLCARIYKVYGSIVRDIFNVLYFYKLGENSTYSLLDDYSGIDLMLNGIPIFAYTNTKASREFRQIKRDERHPELSKIGVALESSIGERKKGKVYLIEECTAKKIIEATKYLRDNDVKRIIRITF